MTIPRTERPGQVKTGGKASRDPREEQATFHLEHGFDYDRRPPMTWGEREEAPLIPLAWSILGLWAVLVWWVFPYLVAGLEKIIIFFRS